MVTFSGGIDMELWAKNGLNKIVYNFMLSYHKAERKPKQILPIATHKD